MYPRLWQTCRMWRHQHRRLRSQLARTWARAKARANAMTMLGHLMSGLAIILANCMCSVNSFIPMCLFLACYNLWCIIHYVQYDVHIFVHVTFSDVVWNTWIVYHTLYAIIWTLLLFNVVFYCNLALPWLDYTLLDLCLSALRCFLCYGAQLNISKCGFEYIPKICM
jgi:hypothetical protein